MKPRSIIRGTAMATAVVGLAASAAAVATQAIGADNAGGDQPAATASAATPSASTATPAEPTGRQRAAITATLRRQAAAERAAARAAARAAKARAATERASRSASRTPRFVGDAPEIAADMAASSYGWGADQFSCLSSLWARESGWQVHASNPRSGAYGIPQALPGSKMAAYGGDWRDDPVTQIAWGLAYVDATYGSPCGAWSTFRNRGWY